jgi:predicted ABC-type ATPase
MPICYVIGGPNGAGKTTAAMTVLPNVNCLEYVNADAIATALSPFKPETMAIKAGRLLLERITELANAQQDFAFESTLAARSFFKFLKRCQANGFEITLIYMWLHSPELAAQRVAKRVEQGGHSIHIDVIYQRYYRSCTNLINLYLPLADNWAVYNNSSDLPTLIAEGDNEDVTLYDDTAWRTLLRSAEAYD